MNSSIPGDIPYQASKTQGLVTQLIISATTGLILFMFFCIVRNRFPSLYLSRLSLKKHPPSTGSGWFEWISKTYHLEEEWIMANVGLDALMFLRLFKLGCSYFAWLCFGAVVLVACNVAAGPNEGAYSTLAIDNVPDGSPFLVAHYMMTVCFVFGLFYFLYRNYKDFITERNYFLVHMNGGIWSRSIKVEGIPEHLRDDYSLQRFFESVGIGRVEKVEFVRDTRYLEGLLERREIALRQFEKVCVKQKREVEAGVDHDIENLRLLPSDVLYNIPVQGRPYMKTGYFGWFGRSVDAIDFLHDRFMQLDAQVRETRNSLFKFTDVAFVTFKKQASANMAAQCLISSTPMTMTTCMATESSDIYWPNVSCSPIRAISMNALITGFLLALSFLWFVPVGLVVSLTNLDELAKLFPRLEPLIGSMDEKLKLIIRDVLPPLIVSSFFSLLPYLFKGKDAHSRIDVSVMSKYFFFLLINVLLIFTITNTLTFNITELIEHPTMILTLLAESLPKNASFFINYVILQAFTVLALQLSNLTNLMYCLWEYLWAKTPRERSEATFPIYVEYGWYYPTALLVFIIVLTFSVVSPIIIPFGLAYFLFGYFIFKHQLAYSFLSHYESGGMFFPRVFNRIMTGVVIFEALMTGMFIFKRSPSLALFCLPLIPITLGFWRYCREGFAKRAYFMPLDAVCESPAQDPSNDVICRERESVILITEVLLPNHFLAYFGSGMSQVVKGVLNDSLKDYSHPAINGLLPQPWISQ